MQETGTISETRASPTRWGWGATLPVLTLLWACLVWGSLPALGASLPEPKGSVVLTVSGAISNENGGGEVRFDRAMLRAIGQYEITTHTIYSSKPSTWRGVLMRDLLDYVGATGETVEFFAYDDYRVAVPVQDYQDFDVLLAFQKDGKDMSLRTRGPTRIIYPHDQHEELQDQKFAARYVWQIRKMIVK